jgi:hypothetical protein
MIAEDTSAPQQPHVHTDEGTDREVSEPEFERGYFLQALQQNQTNVFGGHMAGNGLLPGGGITGSVMTTAAVTNGQPPDKKPPLLNHKLNGTEMAAVRQLITGYRESAAFLLRSADELEHLLQIQPKL